LQPSVRLLLPSVALGTVALTLLLPVMPGLKAHWYTTDCDTYAPPTMGNENCTADFHRASQYSGLFSSARFFIVFLVSSLLGRWSDSVGRIPLLRLNNLSCMMYVLALVVTKGGSASAYYSTFILSGFLSSGSFQVVAYLADFVLPQDRLVAFGSVSAVAGIGLAITPLLSAFSSSVTNQDIFFLSFLCLTLNALYIEMVLPESLVTRKAFARQESLNPITPLIASRESQTLQWLSLVTFLTSLPETGVAEIALLYLDDVLELQGNNAREFSSLYLALTGVGLLLSQTIILRILLKCVTEPIRLLLIAAVFNGLHMLVYSLVGLYPSKGLAFFNVAVTSFMFVGATAANSVLSLHMQAHEQGFAMGTLDSVRSLVGAFGPLLFSQLFSYCGDHWNMPQAPFYLGIILVFMACLVIIGPLKWSMERDRAVNEFMGEPVVPVGSDRIEGLDAPLLL